MYSSLTDKDTDAGSENVRDQVSAEFGNSTRHPDSYSGHLPTLLCNDLEYMFPESTLKIFPGACSSLPVTVIKKKKKLSKSSFGKKGFRGFILSYVFILSLMEARAGARVWNLKRRPQTNTAHHLATPDLLILHSSGPFA